jgi:hypothetical protein
MKIGTLGGGLHPASPQRRAAPIGANPGAL